jgi:hypothetical protein
MERNVMSEITSPMTPQEIVNNHIITERLRRLGLTDEQLASVRYRSNQENVPIEQWPITWGPGVATAAIPQLHDYCRLKWLVLENPPPSSDKEAAAVFVSNAELSPFVKIALRFTAAQSERAKKPRGLLTEDGKTVTALIDDFCARPENRELSAKQLWPRFFAELESFGLDPNAGNDRYTYDGGGRGNERRHISFVYFRNLVSASPAKKKIHNSPVVL